VSPYIIKRGHFPDGKGIQQVYTGGEYLMWMCPLTFKGGLFMKYSACIEMLYQESNFIARIYEAKKSGFDAVEFWLWQPKDLAAVKGALDETGLELCVFQGNIEGRMIDPKDNELYISGVKKSIEAAKNLGAKHLFLMTDILKEDRTVLEPPYPISEEDKIKSIKTVLSTLKPIAEEAGITLVIEPLNIYVDHKGYYLSHSKPAFDMVGEIGSKNIKVLYDIYHMQIMEGNIIETIKDNLDAIGYIHIADVPGRFQPGTGEINFANIFKVLKEINYEGYVGFEFEPKGAASDEVVKSVFEIVK
jgi:hydroxypyruvate isomerase